MGVSINPSLSSVVHKCYNCFKSLKICCVKALTMATSRQYVVGLPEDGKVGSKTTRIHPPGGLSHITYDVMPQTNDAKSSSRVLKAPGGGCSSDSVFSDTSSSTCSMASSPNESRASSTSPKTPSKKYHMKSNFELGDEQPDHPMNTPTRRPYKPSVNPVTGEAIGQPGQFFTPEREHAPPKAVSQERLKNRIPPGGFSSPLW